MLQKDFTNRSLMKTIVEKLEQKLGIPRLVDRIAANFIRFAMRSEQGRGVDFSLPNTS